MLNAFLAVVGGAYVTTTNNGKSADDAPYDIPCARSQGGLTKTKPNFGDLDTIIESYGRCRHFVSGRG